MALTLSRAASISSITKKGDGRNSWMAKSSASAARVRSPPERSDLVRVTSRVRVRARASVWGQAQGWG